MANLRAHYFQHVPFEGLGSMEGWLTANGYDLSVTRFYEADYQVPCKDDVDLLIVMGGPMSVNDEAQYPWLAAEKDLIRDFITSEKPVLGVCLGAQLIANAFGANVFPNHETEIGWFPIHGQSADNPELFQFPEEHLAFHWHGETFELPQGASLLASSHGCKNQAFQIGNNAIGMQCHLETTPASAQALVKHCGDELIAGDFIQSPGQILFANEKNYREINQLMVRVLEFISRPDKAA